MNNSLILVDCQNSFCHPHGSLYVPGAYTSNLRLAEFIENNYSKIDKIYVSLDTHSPKHISFAKNWEDENGNNPQPFTKVNKDGPFTYKYKFSRPFFHDEIDVWPVHCLKYSWGAALTREISELVSWHDNVYYVEKGNINFLEEYSAANKFLSYMKKGEQIIVAGQASNICVYHTVYDLIYKGYYHPNSFVILKDCMDEVPSYKAKQKDFFKMITDGGGLVTTSKEFML